MKRVIIDKLEATYATVSQRRGVYDGENLFYSQHPELATQASLTFTVDNMMTVTDFLTCSTLSNCLAVDRTSLVQDFMSHWHAQRLIAYNLSGRSFRFSARFDSNMIYSQAEISGNATLDPVVVNLLQLWSQVAARRLIASSVHSWRNADITGLGNPHIGTPGDQSFSMVPGPRS